MRCPNCGRSLWFVRTFCPFCKTKIIAPARPKSVTVVGWMFIVLGCGLLFYIMALLPPNEQEYLAQLRSRHPVQAIFFYASPVLSLLGAAFVLLGQNWARWLLVGYLGLNVAVSVSFGPALHSPNGSVRFLTISRGLVFVIVGYFLFRPQTKSFFLGVGTKEQTQSEKSNS